MSTMQKTGWTINSFFLVLSGLKKSFTLDVITRGQSTTIFLCIGPFYAWWQTNKRTNNQMILVQACSWPVWDRQSFATLAVSDLKSDSDLDSIRNSCDVSKWQQLHFAVWDNPLPLIPVLHAGSALLRCSFYETFLQLRSGWPARFQHAVIWG